MLSEVGVFDIENHPKLQEILSNKGFDIEDEVVISREISSEGKSQARINYRVVPVALLKEIGDYLADIHSQFETQDNFLLRLHDCLLLYKKNLFPYNKNRVAHKKKKVVNVSWAKKYLEGPPPTNPS